MTAELGMNLAGVERVFELEAELARMTQRMRALERRADEVRAEMQAEIERVRSQFRAEIVPYRPPGSSLLPSQSQQ
jgi:MerR family transcriptional regulator/heat shock protein HspR